MKVLISSPCSASVIIQYGIKSWPIWECEPSKFKWEYDDKEICLIIEGQAKISTQNGDIYVIFLSCIYAGFIGYKSLLNVLFTWN